MTTFVSDARIVQTILDPRTGTSHIIDFQYERERRTPRVGPTPRFNTREKIEAATADILAKVGLSFVMNPEPLPEFVDLEDRS
jgi:hypothetical protein